MPGGRLQQGERRGAGVRVLHGGVRRRDRAQRRGAQPADQNLRGEQPAGRRPEPRQDGGAEPRRDAGVHARLGGPGPQPPARRAGDAAPRPDARPAPRAHHQHRPRPRPRLLRGGLPHGGLRVLPGPERGRELARARGRVWPAAGPVPGRPGGPGRAGVGRHAGPAVLAADGRGAGGHRRLQQGGGPAAQGPGDPRAVPGAALVERAAGRQEGGAGLQPLRRPHQPVLQCRGARGRAGPVRRLPDAVVGVGAPLRGRLGAQALDGDAGVPGELLQD